MKIVLLKAYNLKFIRNFLKFEIVKQTGLLSNLIQINRS